MYEQNRIFKNLKKNDSYNNHPHFIKNYNNCKKLFTYCNISLDRAKISFYEIGTGYYLGSLDSVYNVTALKIASTILSVYETAPCL